MNKFRTCRIFTMVLVLEIWKHPWWSKQVKNFSVTRFVLGFPVWQHPTWNTSPASMLSVWGCILKLGIATAETHFWAVCYFSFWLWFGKDGKILDGSPSELIGCSSVLLLRVWQAYICVFGSMGDTACLLYICSIKNHAWFATIGIINVF